MELDDIFRHADDALLEDMDGELLLYHPPTAITLHLNGPSAIVWQLCDGQRTCADIIDMVKEAYPQQADQVADDIEQVVTDLAERGVLIKTSE
jgi:hypothetical protein